MRLVAKVLWVLVVVLPIVACNDVHTPPEPLNLTIQGLGGPWFTQLGALEGVQVCEGGTDDNCAMSDANGEVTLKLPIGQVFYTLEKEDFDSVLVAQDHPEGGRTMGLHMWTDVLRAKWYDIYDSPYPRRGTGEIYIEIQPKFAGATFELVGATGTRWYDAPSPLHATATSLFGTGGFVELTPGEHQVKVGGTASQCALNTGWPGDGENSIRTRVREDYVSYVLLQCARLPFNGSALIQVTGKESQGAAWPLPPLGGAEICETDTTNCVTTDAGGMASLELLVNQEVSFSVTKDGYEPKLKVDETDGDFDVSSGVNLWRDELVANRYESVMSPYPQVGTGSVRVGTGGVAGVTCELIDATGNAFYVDEEGQWSLDLEATTSTGSCGFVEVSPGEFQIEIGGTGGGCVPKQGWPGDTENRIRFLVRDGYLTPLSVDCPTP